MKVYKFIFTVGLLNLLIPFLGIQYVYKQYAFITLAIITLGYALIIRAVEKEKENNIIQIKTEEEISVSSQKTIEDVVDMIEEQPRVSTSDGVIKRRGRKPKMLISEQVYE